ncbi:MAG: DNA or RNA helicase of superfamily II [uncultured archaeon A07HB70]|nr:MAG: DNA or RNA helicase of superfamily II [uncultured archaeon A07HB70]
MTDDDGDGDPALDLGDFLDALRREERPVATASEVARLVGCTQAEADAALSALTEADDAGRVDVSDDPVVFYPTEWSRLADGERVVVFPDRREIVAHRPTQFTRARLSQVARLTDTTGHQGYRYVVEPADVWNAPFEDLADLLVTLRSVLPRRDEGLEAWIEDQWERARLFTLRSHDDGYTVLTAETPELMGNVAEQHLGEAELHGPVDDTTAWVREGEEASIKRALYEAGYPVRDERDLETGDPLDVDLTAELRDYQRDWVDRFLDRSAGVLVGPPGSGKTVAALGILAAVGGETLVLVPSRELARQWHDEILAHTTLAAEQVGEYHGGTKQLRPVTVATYHVAGMDRHRSLFDDREWGLVVFDEAHHMPSPVHRRAADLQSRHRLGLTASPVREDDAETEIFTLVGPPIGTDWDALFDAGHVAEPTVELRFVPWEDDDERNAWASADGHERRLLAATNPAKVDEVRRLLATHEGEQTLVFVDYLDQGETVAAALDVPFLSGETPHYERERLLGAFRDGRLETLAVSRVGDEGIDLPNAEVAVVASGLGGSRRQGAQRAGRTMRPGGEALVYVLATQGTGEEEFARNRTRHLAGKGVRVRETRL